MTRSLGIFSLSALVVAFFSGCSTTATMIPVEGPLSESTPPPVLEVHVAGITGNNGSLDLVMPDGESCSGRWSSAAGAGITVGSASLLSTYGSTYATGYSVSTGTGQNPGQAILVCDRGRTIQVEFVTGAGTAHGFGIGRDNEGNVYKLIF